MSGSCSAPVCASAASQRIHIHGSWRSVPHRTHSRTQASPQRSLTSFSSAPARRIPTRRIRRLSCRTSWVRVRSARSISTTPAPALSPRPTLRTVTLNPARQRPYWLSRRKRFRASWTTPTARPAFCSATVPLQPFIRRLRTKRSAFCPPSPRQTVRAQSTCTWKPCRSRIRFPVTARWTRRRVS